MHYLNVSNPLPKIEEILHLVKLANAFVIGISETKLDGSVFNSEIVIEDHNIIRLDHSRKGGGWCCLFHQTLCHLKL